MHANAPYKCDNIKCGLYCFTQVAVVEVYNQTSGRRYFTDSGSLIWTDLALWEPNNYGNFLQLGEYRKYTCILQRHPKL